MKIFRKKKVEVIDLTKLQKKGILQRSMEIASNNETENLRKDEVVDLRDLNNLKNANSDNSNMFGFLNNLAGVGASENISQKVLRGGQKDIEHLRVKIEDIEYKLDRFLERLERIEENLKG